MKKDEKAALWFIGLGALIWLCGIASFGVTGVSVPGIIAIILSSLFGPLTLLIGPVAFALGLYLLGKSLILRLLDTIQHSRQK